VKCLLILLGLWFGLQAASAELSLREVRTASDDVLVAYFKSTIVQADEANTGDLSLWKLDGQPVAAIHKFVTEADACDHHVYLQTTKLVQGATYKLETPHGGTNFVFDERRILCESISDLREGVWLLLSFWRGRGFFAPAGAYLVPCFVSSAVRLPDRRAACVEHPDETLSHHDLRHRRPDRRSPAPVQGDEPAFTAYGGYHDAGDADRRTYHMDVTATLLTSYEAFPGRFTDDQFNIPDKFDEHYNIVGQGNQMPDILDEAEWGAMFWEYMQKPSGAIHWGTETYRYSPFTTYDQETKLFGTEVLDPRSAGFASGMFLHLARLIKPYKPERTAELLQRADRAFAAAGDRIRPTHKLYYAVQKYLLTGDETAHQIVKELADSADAYTDTYNGACESFAGSNRPGGRDGWLASFFFSYITEQSRLTDPIVVEKFRAAIKAAADKQIGFLEANAYPVGAPMNLRWWGSNVAQGQYAYPCLLHWALTNDQEYIDAASQLMDYTQGLNPIGKCYESKDPFANPAGISGN